MNGAEHPDATAAGPAPEQRRPATAGPAPEPREAATAGHAGAPQEATTARHAGAPQDATTARHAGAPQDATTARHTPSSFGRCAGRRSDIDHGAAYPIQLVGVRRLMVAPGPARKRIAAIASAQRGIVTREQARAAGIDDSAFARLLRRGEISRLHRGVYRVGPATGVPLAPETAAVLACGKDAVLSHRSAARVWELPVPPGRTVDVLLAAHGPEPTGVTVHRTRILTPQDIRHRHGLPLTSPARTLLDLADTLTARPLERALYEALARRIVRRAQLHEVLSRANGRRGAGALEALLAPGRHSTRTRSGPEELFLTLVRQARLPEPETNAPFLDFDVDVLWRAQRLAVEIDSYDYHSSPQKFQRDRAKGAAIVRAGFTLLRPTPEQIEEDSLALMVTIGETLARAA